MSLVLPSTLCLYNFGKDRVGVGLFLVFTVHINTQPIIYVFYSYDGIFR